MKRIASEVWSDFPALDLVQSSRTIRRVGMVSLGILLVGALALLIVPWRQTAVGTGTVIAKDPQQRPQPFKSPIKGIVKSVKPDLREGSFVQAGDVLIELEPVAEGGAAQLDLQIAAVTNKVELAKSKVEFASQQIQLQSDSGARLQEALAAERTAAETKWEQSKSELAAAESELVDKSNKRRIAEDVFEKGIISREELVTKRQDEQTQIQKVAKSEQAVQEAAANLEAKRREIESKEHDIEIKNRDSQNKMLAEQKELQSILKELSDLEIKRQEFQRLRITAPRTGYIQQWYGVEGSDTVKEGDQLFVIVPDADELAVEMLISGNDMPLVQVGDRVRLVFEGWPAVQFVRGWPTAAIGTFGAAVNRVLPTDDGKGNFQVLVVADKHMPQDRDWPDTLRQGVRTNGWILLREVPLGYEVWRQINGFPPARTDIESDSKGDKPKKLKAPKL